MGDIDLLGDMVGHYYILRGHDVLPVNVKEWALWYEKNNPHVADETIEGVRVSTVFLGLNHQWGDGPPLIFETMVFGGPLNQEMERCSTWKEAEAMHQRMKDRVKKESRPGA